MAESALPRRRSWAIGSVVLGAAMLVVYVGVIVSEGNNTLSDILPWAAVMTIPPALAFTAVLAKEPRVARNLMIGAAVLFGVLGVLSMFTIGMGFLVAAAVTAVGASKV